MRKSAIIGTVVVIVLIFGIAGFYFLNSDSKKENNIPSQKGGCDGKCDEFEKQHPESGCYKPDCLGIYEDNEFDLDNSFSSGQQEVTLEKINSNYKTTIAKPTGWFSNQQSADLLLSGIDFNNAGGPLLFNHQGGIASDEKHFMLADRNNNRILIWNSLPEGNTEPNIVLGQENFFTNNPGDGLNELNWPVSVATDGEHLLVADTYNHRILIWNNFPTTNAEPADIVLQGLDDPSIKGNIAWPWAVWTDGEKIVVTSTASSQVLIWNTFPTQNNQEPNIVIKLDDFGTPRTIGSDGTNLVIGDHNAFRSSQGNFFWETFPTQDNQQYDFFMPNAQNEREGGEIMWGPTFTEDGKFVIVSDKLYIWDGFPEDETDEADFSIGSDTYDFGGIESGDGSSIVYTNGKLYISLCNGNKVVGYNTFPTVSKKPDFSIGSPDIYTNTLETEFIISNPVPATNGNSLFVSSDFDRKLYVWKSLPDESGANPDFVYTLTDAPWDNVIHNNILTLAGKKTLFIWNNLPLNGELPDVIFRDKIGNVEFQDLQGVAMDDKYFYLTDNLANKIYVWEGIPNENSNPIFSLDAEGPSRISSDGKYLVVNSVFGQGGSILIYRINEFPNAKQNVLTGMFNLPQGVLVYDRHLFVGDTGFNTVHIWTDIEDAILGEQADIFLGEKGRTPSTKEGKLFWSTSLAYDGSYLWVGEFKFSERLLRFSVV
ncbi:MAG: hypothetical protein KKF68_02805 [Nanoarchaeota archaeon]|nr:hypothetical protein [Nanoarchaeota archaeon]